MIKKLFKKAVKMHRKTENDISDHNLEHNKVRQEILQHHKDTSERIKKFRNEWGFTQYK